eukprot:CAMPEP_0204392762 /NCGR_PEP_ID=MMETSP0469-20131031/61937_1 /ASSEMBLY_ACC=CAM_ASM_000384 /TAXON_ID=2969 /ORGANISM="Oxyrrhis marina" /LENGTH=59 /DNA_ID=CAMNT_0051386767 /DNA_START=79 /DNA_END=255 /DNA_ORIENTATION=+
MSVLNSNHTVHQHGLRRGWLLCINGLLSIVVPKAFHKNGIVTRTDLLVAAAAGATASSA